MRLSHCLFLMLVSSPFALPPVAAQSDLLRASERLSGTLVEVPAASLGVLKAGGEFSVAALRPIGASVEVVLIGASEAGRFSLVLSREALEASGVVVGVTLVAVAVSGGVLLMAGSEAVAFLLDPRLAEHQHRRELQP
jgi:hypothetical protein